MTRQEATLFARTELNKHGLTDWSIRLNQDANSHFLGLCAHKDKCIILSAHHIDIHPDPEVINTIRHEIAHALTPGHRHDDVWESKAREVGCDNTMACSTLSLSPDIIDAIRSGATVEVTFEEQVIRRPKYNITRLQDKCPTCGKVAKTQSENTVQTNDDTTPDVKYIWLECGHVIVRRIPKGTPFGQFQMGGDPNCKHAWVKNKCGLCNRVRPYDFQIEGMRACEAGLAVNQGFALFDEMGLGKTIQAQGVLHYHPEHLPCLWIVKSGLKYQIAGSLVRWNGVEHVPQIIETSKDWLMPGFKHYIIGYDMLVPKVRMVKGKEVVSGFDISEFDRVGIKCVVLDECQLIKNADSSRTQMVRRVVKGRKVIPLSGTPWKNKGSELFPVFNMMDPMRFHSAEGFKSRWVQTYWQGRYQKEGGIRNPERFKEYTKDLCIRRERTEVMAELPLINRTKLYVKMDLAQEKAYDAAVEEFVNWYQTQAADISSMNILAAMSKMRHLSGLAKNDATLEYVHEFIEDTDKKIVIFVHHKDVGEILAAELKEEYSKETEEHGRVPVFVLTSALDGQQRFQMCEDFNKATQAIMIASTLASGEGLNLQTCSDCIMHERQWNPANEEQAEGRFIRIGQTATSVSAIYTQLEGLSSIDAHFDALVERKRFSFHQTMNKGEAPKWNNESLIKELADAIISGHIRKKRKAS
jgi:hypothetical protein